MKVKNLIKYLSNINSELLIRVETEDGYTLIDKDDIIVNERTDRGLKYRKLTEEVIEALEIYLKDPTKENSNYFMELVDLKNNENEFITDDYFIIKV